MRAPPLIHPYQYSNTVRGPEENLHGRRAGHSLLQHKHTPHALLKLPLVVTGLINCSYMFHEHIQIFTTDELWEGYAQWSIWSYSLQLSVNHLLDYAKDLATKTLHPCPPGLFLPWHCPPLSWRILCVLTQSCLTLCNLFFLSLSLMNFLAMGKTLDSSLSPYYRRRGPQTFLCSQNEGFSTKHVSIKIIKTLDI